MEDTKIDIFLRKTIPAILLFLVFLPHEAYAYIGPGAGFAVVSSFFILFVTGFVAFFAIIAWPFRTLLRSLKLRKINKNRRVKRVVILGLDGMDPTLAARFMDEGKLPNFSYLREKGSFQKLDTTTPSISPVAWSTFATGVNPGKHRIFDFYTRDPRNYLPVLSSVQISSYEKILKIGPIRIPRKKVSVKFLRKSTSFWKILGEQGIFSSILRVPITFPPEKIYGTCLSAMCTPDLRGTQGSFTLFSPMRSEATTEGEFVGNFSPLKLNGDGFLGEIEGPQLDNKKSETLLTLPFTGKINREKKSVKIRIDKTNHELELGKYSPWIKLPFKAGFRKRISGIARFLLIEIDPVLKIYMCPINIDPNKPALPVSHPFIYSASLSKLYGSFSTLGLSEDTWALNCRVIDEEQFLKQTYDIYEGREKHFKDTLKHVKEGLVVNVFDTTDRIQHMFFRYLDAEHPANRDKDSIKFKNAIEDVYTRMDKLLEDIMARLGKSDILLVLSDHGFCSFKWGINLNSWLHKEGYLVFKDGIAPGLEWFRGVDWSRTRAYAYGLTGIFLNVKNREKEGIVKRGKERDELSLELKSKLTAFLDKKNGNRPIRRVIISEESLHGPYTQEAPDLIIGYEPGYRISWNAAIGKVTEDVIEDNTRSWSGDHSIDPELVPGVFFSNWTLNDDNPSITDFAPTVLNLFGMKPRGFHDGKVLHLTKPLQN